MSEQAHTRWEVSDFRSSDDEALVVGGEGQSFGLIAAVTNDDDAHLIAAAPDLLAFAEAHDAYMSKHYADGPDSGALHPDAAANWKACRAAIERASAAGRSAPTPTEVGGRG